MSISQEELNEISSRLTNLATECGFMYDECKIHSRLIGCYCGSLERAIDYLQVVLRRSEDLKADLHSVCASLDDLLEKERILDNSGV